MNTTQLDTVFLDHNTIARAAVDNTVADEKQGAGYLARPEGSFVKGLNCNDGSAVATLLSILPWQDVTAEAEAMGVRLGACRYYRGILPDSLQGVEAIALLSELTDEELGQVRVVRSNHGGLTLAAEGIDPRPTRVVHLVVGDIGVWPPTEYPTPETARVVTWYPGRLTPSFGAADFAVKLLR